MYINTLIFAGLLHCMFPGIPSICWQPFPGVLQTHSDEGSVGAGSWKRVVGLRGAQLHPAWHAPATLHTSARCTHLRSCLRDWNCQVPLTWLLYALHNYNSLQKSKLPPVGVSFKLLLFQMFFRFVCHSHKHACISVRWGAFWAAEQTAYVIQRKKKIKWTIK